MRPRRRELGRPAHARRAHRATNDAYVAYLIDRRPEVAESVRARTSQATDPYDQEFMRDLGRRPYLRWLGALAAQALIAGKYRLALSTAEDALELAPEDPGDVRHTATLALAKLEATRDELAAFRRRHATAYLPPAPFRRRHTKQERPADAWTLIAELACAYHELDFSGATRALRTLMRAYPRTAEALYYQAEFPEGLFARVHVIPGSEDELILALSESTPLLQEGLGATRYLRVACLASWIASHPLVTDALSERRHGAGAVRRAAPGVTTDGPPRIRMRPSRAPLSRRAPRAYARRARTRARRGAQPTRKVRRLSPRPSAACLHGGTRAPDGRARRHG